MAKHGRKSGSNRSARPQVVLRTMIVLLLSLAAGVVTTVLLWSTAVPMAQAVLGGIASSAGTFRFFDGSSRRLSDVGSPITVVDHFPYVSNQDKASPVSVVHRFDSPASSS